MMPFWALFLGKTYNYTEENIILFFSIFSISVFLTEIPVGFLSDRIGAKISSVIGLTLKALSIILLLMPKFFIIPFVSQFLVGIGESFCSGSRESLSFRYYKASNKKKSFHSFNAASNAVNWLGILVSFIFSSIIAKMGFSYLLICSLLAYVFAVISLCFVQITAKNERRYTKSIGMQLKQLSGLIVKDKNLSSIIFITAIIQAMLSSMFMLFQPLMNELSLADSYNGFIYAMATAFAIIGSLLQPKIRNMFSSDLKQGIWLSIALIVLCNLISIIDFSFLRIALLFSAFRFLFGFSGSAVSSMLNMTIREDSLRSSTFSVQSLCINLMQFVVLFLLQLIDVSTSVRYFILSLLLGLSLVFLYLLYKRRRLQK